MTPTPHTPTQPVELLQHRASQLRGFAERTNKQADIDEEAVAGSRKEAAEALGKAEALDRAASVLIAAASMGRQGSVFAEVPNTTLSGVDEELRARINRRPPPLGHPQDIIISHEMVERVRRSPLDREYQGMSGRQASETAIALCRAATITGTWSLLLTHLEALNRVYMTQTKPPTRSTISPYQD